MAKKHDDDGRLKRKEYEKEIKRLQGELCKLQDWVKHRGLRVIVIFEGRDAAGKGGTIRAITERVSPRFSAWSHCLRHPTAKKLRCTSSVIWRTSRAGEIVIFDRSWYNRAGVEHVMGFCSPEQHEKFLELCPTTESISLTPESF